MTTNISYASDDGYITSSSTSYDTASAGTGTKTLVSGTSALRVGQNKSGSTYEIYESFLSFPYTLDTTTRVVSAYFDLFQESVTGTSVDRQLGIRDFAYGTLTTADYRTPSQISALSRYGLTPSIQTPSNKHVYSLQSNLNDWLRDVTGTKQVIVYNNRISGAIVPAGAEYGNIRATEASGTSTDPALVWTSVPIQTLYRVGGCQVELSDGRHVYLEVDTGGDVVIGTLKRHDGVTATTIATNIMQSGNNRGYGSTNAGMQSMALVRDASDNLYLIGHTANAGNTITIVTWKKTGTSTWVELTPRQIDMPSADGVINNIAAAWHNVATSGTIMVLVDHDEHISSPTPTNEMSYALVSCAYLLNTVSPLLRGSGDAYAKGLVTAATNSTDWNQPLNQTGSCLDLVALPGSTNRGVIVSTNRDAVFGDYGQVSVVRYILNSTGSGFSAINAATSLPAIMATKDAFSKIRVLPIDANRFAIVAVDKDTGWGPVIRIVQNIGTSTTFSVLGSTLLAGESIASLPAPATLDDSWAWDVAYNKDSNWVYFWYFDTANGQRLMRTSFDLNTYQALRDETQVNAAVAATGTTNHAIRVDRSTLTKSEVLVSIANKDSGGVESTIYVTDRLNVAPSAPILVDQPNYDATVSTLYDWTFVDANVGDAQTAYQLIIENADTGAGVVDTGKVVSATTDRTVAGGTLTNGVNYRWKVRTWDSVDVVGPYSTYDFFSTAAGGTVNITDPATDNLAGLIVDSYTIHWAATGTTQTKYRVRVVRTDTSAQLVDTGFVTSTDTFYTILNMASDVEYQIQVTLKNVSDISTNTAVRLITVSYAQPEVPALEVLFDSDNGNIVATITNPPPQGDRPEVDYNLLQRRQAGVTDWTTIATLPYNGSYPDYRTGSGILYEYQAVAVASTGRKESEIIQGSIFLQGVWLHKPSDPANTIENFLYGKNQRGDQHQSYSQLTHFAGREYPVADFAKYHDHVFNVTVDIPFGEDYDSKRDAIMGLEQGHETLVYRDNRRRNSFGILVNMSLTDTEWGTSASFDFTRVDYAESVV